MRREWGPVRERLVRPRGGWSPPHVDLHLPSPGVWWFGRNTGGKLSLTRRGKEGPGSKKGAVWLQPPQLSNNAPNSQPCTNYSQELLWFTTTSFITHNPVVLYSFSSKGVQIHAFSRDVHPLLNQPPLLREDPPRQASRNMLGGSGERLESRKSRTMWCSLCLPL